MNTTDSPWIRTVSLVPPTLQDNTADTDRLIHALKSKLKTAVIDIDVELLRQLADVLHNADYKVRCVVFRDRQKWILMDVVNLDDTCTIAGLAADLGTSRVELRLLDLDTGRTMAESAFDNPQEAVGPDVLTRIHFADQPGGLEKLNELIINELNRAIHNMCTANGLEPQKIYALSVAGNTIMIHLFMGLNPRWLIREPYIPVVNTPAILKAHTLGIRIHSQAAAFIFPNIGSYYGILHFVVVPADQSATKADLSISQADFDSLN